MNLLIWYLNSIYPNYRMKMSKIPKWITVYAETNEVHCEYCGEREHFKLPMPISSFVKWCKYFGDKHKFCKPPFLEGLSVKTGG